MIRSPRSAGAPALVGQLALGSRARLGVEALAERLAVPLVALAATLYLVVYAPFVLTWPPVSSDEGREMNAFWVASGRDPSATLLDPFFGRDPLYKGGLQGLSVAITFRLAGLSLANARLVSSAWGGLLLVAAFLAGRRLFGPAAGAVGAALLAASQPFLLAAHFVRPDIVVAALLMLALWLALAPPARRLEHLAGGLLLGLAVDVHPNALAFGPLILLAPLLSAGAARPAAVRWVLAGLALGGLVYLLARVAPDPARFVAAFDFWVGAEKRPPLLDRDPVAAVAAEWRRFSEAFAGRPYEPFLLAAGLAWSAWGALAGDRGHRAVLLGVGAAFLVFSALVASKVPFYLVLYYGPLCLLLGAATADGLRRLPGRLAVGVVVTAALALVGFGLLDYTRDLAHHAMSGDQDYELLARRLREDLPPDAVVIAQPLYWPALADHRFVDLAVADRLRLRGDFSFAEFVRQSGASAFLVDDDTRQALPSADRAWLNQAFPRRASITQKYYGTIDVRTRRP